MRWQHEEVAAPQHIWNVRAKAEQMDTIANRETVDDTLDLVEPRPVPGHHNVQVRTFREHGSHRIDQILVAFFIAHDRNHAGDDRVCSEPEFTAQRGVRKGRGFDDAVVDGFNAALRYTR